MTILDNEAVLRILRENGREWRVEPSPRQGKLRIAGMSNDVVGAVERMGGLKKAAKLLKVSEDQIDEWIDNYHVPQPYADMINKITGHWLYSIQESTVYVTDGVSFWPHVPTQAQLNSPYGIPMLWGEPCEHIEK
jgi:hypothetical protein